MELRDGCKAGRDLLIYELNAQTNPPETNLLVTDADLFSLYQCQHLLITHEYTI